MNGNVTGVAPPVNAAGAVVPSGLGIPTMHGLLGGRVKLFDSDQKPGPGAAGVKRNVNTASTTMASKTTRETVLAAGKRTILDGIEENPDLPKTSVTNMDESPNDPHTAVTGTDGEKQEATDEE